MSTVTTGDVQVLTHECTAILVDTGHKFRIELRRQGGNCFVGMSVVAHAHPNGHLCTHDTSHLIGIHKNFEILLADVIEKHLDVCKTKWQKSKFRIVR